ncbi:hypothetical protein GCM10010287_17550 [Streptomyces variabilis]|uniref:Uncharacterized protein n=1 Tax=Streptomyces variabilis TaxID=67372 RepID=A0ABQ2TWQ5_9ACTN|nr:hypothetical protein GCM10010265_58230 [Streptomyces griseoincarnatus]GGT44916.1 hypothetical protein GCM10010287_17550 [Streptomyces variabilis]
MRFTAAPGSCGLRRPVRLAYGGPVRPADGGRFVRLTAAPGSLGPRRPVHPALKGSARPARADPRAYGDANPRASGDADPPKPA